MLSVAAFDLETCNLNADYGILGVAVVKTTATKKPIVFRGDQLNKRWKTRRSDDSAIVKAVAEELKRHDILIAHNGAAVRFGFDIPFLQARLAHHGMPVFPRMKIIDPVQIARKNFRLSGYSLETIANHLGLEMKMKLPPSVWTEAFLDGCPKAMDTLVARCVSDVRILCGVVDAVKGYCATLDSRGSSW